MARTLWQEGSIIRKSLDDGWTYYGRLLAFPWAAFYRLRTKEPSGDLHEITASPVLFIIAAHKDLAARNQWAPIGRLPLEASLRPPEAQAVWDDAGTCQIIDAEGEMRPATPEECEGLEPAAVWEPEHIADRLQDAFAGRENRWLRDLRPRRD